MEVQWDCWQSVLRDDRQKVNQDLIIFLLLLLLLLLTIIIIIMSNCSETADNRLSAMIGKKPRHFSAASEQAAAAGHKIQTRVLQAAAGARKAPPTTTSPPVGRWGGLPANQGWQNGRPKSLASRVAGWVSGQTRGPESRWGVRCQRWASSSSFRKASSSSEHLCWCFGYKKELAEERRNCFYKIQMDYFRKHASCICQIVSTFGLLWNKYT